MNHETAQPLWQKQVNGADFTEHLRQHHSTAFTLFLALADDSRYTKSQLVKQLDASTRELQQRAYELLPEASHDDAIDAMMKLNFHHEAVGFILGLSYGVRLRSEAEAVVDDESEVRT